MVKAPHILLAGSNCKRVRSNLAHLLDPVALGQIDNEIQQSVIAMFRLGEEHFAFAQHLAKPHWRQAISRCYYGAYNVLRSLRLEQDGHFATDSSDHKKIDDLPIGFPNRSTYTVQFPLLRNDRNLCDYDHLAIEGDLVITRQDTMTLVADFIREARAYLGSRGTAV